MGHRRGAMPRGRQTKLTRESQNVIVTALAGGVPFKAACQHAGINVDTGYEWLVKGAHPAKAPIYAEFVKAVEEARAKDEMRRVARIDEAARGGAVVYRRTVVREDGSTTTEERFAPPDWQADAWHLERKLPDQWGRRERLEHTGPGGGAQQIQVVYEEEKEATLQAVATPVRLLIKEG